MFGAIARWSPLAAAVVVALHGRTRAYLDPGAGSLVTQMLIAGFAGAAYVLKTRWRKLKRLLGRQRERDSNPEKSKGTDGEEDR